MARNSRALVHLPAAFLAGLLILTHSQCTPKLPWTPVTGAIEPLAAPFAMLQPARPSFPEAEFDIRDFGAIEGGTAKNTGAIREAIVAATHAGGGHVLIPPGTWLTGAIHLESNIDLHLLRGAELLFSQDPADYLPVVFSRHEDIECYKYSAFIYAEGKSNIAVTGEGVLYGQGKPWWAWKQSKRDAEKELYTMGANNVPVAQRIFDGKGGLELRPAFFQPVSCSNVLVEGVTFLYGAFWTLTPTYCENVIIRNVHIETEGTYGHTPNGDGVDPSSCRNVLIEHCTFDTGDDCIAIKAGRDADGLRVARPTENVVIRHCQGLRGHGGIVIGSETSGGIRNIYAHDCQFTGTDRIVRIKTARGRGGVLENMWFRNLAADTIELEALHINMLYTGTRLPEAPVTKATPVIRNIHYSNITCKFAKGRAVEILGLPESPVESVSIDNITMNAARGIACTDARDITLNQVSVIADRSPTVDLTDCQRVTLGSVSVTPCGDPFLQVSGARSAEITLRGAAFRDKVPIVRVGVETPPGAVIIAD
jgi:polygalacturonase